MSTHHKRTGKLPPQSMLQERYLILGVRGRGGMSVVYEAVDIRAGQQHVAIKEMSLSSVVEEDLPLALARFQQEAAMLRALTHPNLPRIHNAFSEDGRSYLVMDYIDGKTLLQILRENDNQPLSVAQVLQYTRQLCDVLDYLHQQSPPIIFRDVKPTNIMVTQTGHIFLIDFGIARFFKEGQEHDTEYLGSRGYAAPEQHGMGQTTPRTDIYALGVTLHHCLTSRDPYHAADPFVFAPISQVNPQVPPALAYLVHQMTAFDEEFRPGSVLEVKHSLSTIAEQATEATTALPPPMPTPIHVGQSIPPGIGPGGLAAVALEPPPIAPAGFLPVGKPSVRLYSAAQGGTQPVVQSPPFWQAGFLILFLFSLVIVSGAVAFALSSFDPLPASPTVWVECVLSSVVWLMCLVSYWRVVGPLPRSLLALSSIFMLLASCAFLVLAVPDIQYRLATVLAPGTPYLEIATQVVTGGLLGTTLVSLLWLLHPASWSMRGAFFFFFMVSLICSLCQSVLPTIDFYRHMWLEMALATLFIGLLLVVRQARVQP